MKPGRGTFALVLLTLLAIAAGVTFGVARRRAERTQQALLERRAELARAQSLARRIRQLQSVRSGLAQAASTGRGPSLSSRLQAILPPGSPPDAVVPMEIRPVDDNLVVEHFRLSLDAVALEEFLAILDTVDRAPAPAGIVRLAITPREQPPRLDVAVEIAACAPPAEGAATP